MHRRLWFLAFVTYVALDLSSPFIAGAFNFNPDECVEAAHREQQVDAASSDAARPAAERVDHRQVETHAVVRSLPAPAWHARWRFPSPLAHASASSAPSRTEDH
jgi:hypothetical protein